MHQIWRNLFQSISHQTELCSKRYYHMGYSPPGARELSGALLKCYGLFGLGFLAHDPQMIGSHSTTYRTFMKWNPKRRGVTAHCPEIQKSKVPGNNNKKGEQQRPQHKISTLSWLTHWWCSSSPMKVDWHQNSFGGGRQWVNSIRSQFLPPHVHLDPPSSKSRRFFSSGIWTGGAVDNLQSNGVSH